MYSVYLSGGPLVYPLFFDYPEDDNCFIGIENTYMLGDSIKVSPVLDKGLGDLDNFTSYFPSGAWADLNNQSNILNSTGQNIILDSAFGYTNIHLKAGKIIPY